MVKSIFIWHGVKRTFHLPDTALNFSCRIQSNRSNRLGTNSTDECSERKVVHICFFSFLAVRIMGKCTSFCHGINCISGLCYWKFQPKSEINGFCEDVLTVTSLAVLITSPRSAGYILRTVTSVPLDAPVDVNRCRLKPQTYGSRFCRFAIPVHKDEETIFASMIYARTTGHELSGL
jgi:hypothetical protein